MKKGQVMEGVIGRVEFPNKGIVNTEEGTVIVKNGVPGQKIRFAIIKKRKNHAEGRLLEVLGKSPLETRSPACSLFPDCGGCMYQTMPYEEQLKMKSAQVRALIEPVLVEAGQVQQGTEDTGADNYRAEDDDAQTCQTEQNAENNKSGKCQTGQVTEDRNGAGISCTEQAEWDNDAQTCQTEQDAENNKSGKCQTGQGSEDRNDAGISCTVQAEWDNDAQTSGTKTGPRADYIFDGIKGSPQEFGYRNKMEFSFGDEYKDGPLVLGLHRKGSTYDVLPVKDCAIVHADFNRIVQTVQEYCRTQKFSYYHKISHQGYLRHLLVRRAEMTGEIMVCLVTTSQKEYDFAPLGAALQELQAQGHVQGEIIGFLHMINDSLADVVRSDRSRLIFGRDYFYETLLGLTFKITPFSFFQTNSKGAEVLYSTVRDYVGETKDRIVFDLYSGTGTIAQLAAPVARRVIGVEIVEEAVEAARENAARNGLTNCEFIAGDVLKVIDEIPDRPDFIILDPPRDGIHPRALTKIIDYGADRLVYISCKPTSLARDLKVFLENGYRLERMACADLFCETQHVETVCLLSNRKPDSYVHLNPKMEDYYRIKDSQKEQDKK